MDVNIEIEKIYILKYSRSPCLQGICETLDSMELYISYVFFFPDTCIQSYFSTQNKHFMASLWHSFSPVHVRNPSNFSQYS